MNYSETCLDRIPLLQQNVVLEDSWSLKILTDHYFCHPNVDFQNSSSLIRGLIYIDNEDLWFFKVVPQKRVVSDWSQMLYVKSTRYIVCQVGINIFELCPLNFVLFYNIVTNFPRRLSTFWRSEVYFFYNYLVNEIYKINYYHLRIF